MQPAAPSERIRVFGNLKKQALMDVWNSPDFRRFRSMVLAGDFPEVCQDCDYAAGLTG
jgi:MoaA/NifB/PqqE/SkfB family radical SAM enzyme